ncbi:three prime repair exonuclease 1 [Trichinella spiralis]|uniref:Three prime repair exonuclease 2 n=1 Tax=Trichinella spiralis TaxID=6334 RepID=E5SH23_TRISP|nr:three prime repair exonuclease 1 [Trichinella spiralis]KRY43250.1 Three prime repair exonuclease 2 [Trichinella spiralis]
MNVEHPDKICDGTLVFLDVETTGLVGKQPSITEIAVVAVGRRHFLTFSNNPSAYTKLPRVMSKLVSVINPAKSISPTASLITGLNPANVAAQPTFAEFYQTLHSFLLNLIQPVTLIAHNGLQFDFPILKTEMARCGNPDLPATFFCCDSLKLFRLMDNLLLADMEKKRAYFRTFNNNQNVLTSVALFSSPVSASSAAFSSSTSEAVVQKDDDLVDLPKSSVEMSSSLNCNLQGGIIRYSFAGTESYKLHHTLIDSRWYPNASRKLNFDSNIENDQLFPKKDSPKAKIRLEGICGDSTSLFATFRYSLKDLYLRMFGDKLQMAHCAENDCIALLRCALMYGEEFLSQSLNNSIPFNSIPYNI